MNYRGYEVVEKDNSIYVENVQDFNPVHTLECGQCFRWKRLHDGRYFGIAGEKAVELEYNNGVLEITNSGVRDFIDLWYDYFDLGTDYTKIKEMLRKDEIMAKAIDYGSGIRLLRQNIWEMTISFILSANNRIPMIMKAVAAISKAYGRQIHSGADVFYAFPDVKKLADTGVEELEACGGGFRCKYIVNTARMIRDGSVNLIELREVDTAVARNELMKLPGVGPKVSDCILLYSGTKYDVFPTDVWVKRVMEELYFKREASFKEIQQFASEHFGELAGFAQQYLFYYARENRIGAA